MSTGLHTNLNVLGTATAVPPSVAARRRPLHASLTSCAPSVTAGHCVCRKTRKVTPGWDTACCTSCPPSLLACPPRRIQRDGLEGRPLDSGDDAGLDVLGCGNWITLERAAGEAPAWAARLAVVLGEAPAGHVRLQREARVLPALAVALASDE